MKIVRLEHLRIIILLIRGGGTIHFNTYDQRQSARAIIPTVIIQLLSGRVEIRVGSLYPKRDLNYVDDICRGFIALTKCDDAVGREVNIEFREEISTGILDNLIIELQNSVLKLFLEIKGICQTKVK